ncbi:MAG TPA: 6-phosphogluconolactonase [Jatrophihabitans sp.]|nr:6-phosphogluconolactonase [Jatrophihabitans sp.]
MGLPPDVIVQDDAEQLAADVALRALGTLAAAQSSRGRAVLALTAGSILEAVWQAIADSPSASTVDWSRVDVCWADERFVPADSDDRNDLPAKRILLGHPPFSAARHLPMPASDGAQPDLDAAAAFYAGQLAALRRPDDTGELPDFDLVLLGVGPDGHCASLFPNHPGTFAAGQTVIGVRNSPKPPPNRLSFTFDTLDRAAEIWFVVSGSGKAEAVALAHSGASREQIPSAGPKGRQRTLWLVDRDAAALL